MNLKRKFLYTRKQWEHRQYFTVKGGMRVKRYKNEITVVRPGIKPQPKHRHRRSFISCRLPKLVGNRVVYRLFKATRWFKEPNTKYRREEKYYE